ncbi:putative membrane protein [Neisseria musculi]|uniref:Membrane protein n=1 Tax=Neisseria musculi TaxID=1815583 RepID=A0A7H1MF42_9NEIS|nr:putative membrane protein [Neisseria musculi]
MIIYLCSAIFFFFWLGMRSYTRRKTWAAALIVMTAMLGLLWTFAAWYDVMHTYPQDKTRIWLLLGCHSIFLIVFSDYLLYFFSKIQKK